MKPLVSVCVPLSLLCMAITGHAEIMIVPSVQEQMAKSDLVFVGHVVDVLGEGAADVQIDRMISSRSLITSRRLEVWPAEGSRTGDLWVDELPLGGRTGYFLYKKGLRRERAVGIEQRLGSPRFSECACK